MITYVKEFLEGIVDGGLLKFYCFYFAFTFLVVARLFWEVCSEHRLNIQMFLHWAAC